MLDGLNHFTLVGSGPTNTRNGLTIEYFHRERPNPLITQQDAAVVLIQFGSSLPKEKHSQLYDQLVKTDRSILERMLCGPSSALTCLRSLQSENGMEQVNSTHISSLLADICALDGSRCTNPQTGSPFDKGWQVFAKQNNDVRNWEIYHHALAYGIDKLSNGFTTTTGIMRFSTEDLFRLISAQSKIIVSVSNSIVSGEQMNQRVGNVLREGSHLVAIIGSRIDPRQIYLADPYVEPFSSYDVDPIPRLVSLDSIEKFLKPTQHRKGLVISKADKLPKELLQRIEYPLAKPNI